MRVLLVRPPSPNERFGLGPFFKVEPLGMLYVAAALERDGHEVYLSELRWDVPLETTLSRFKPDVVGISCMHTVDVPAAQDVARRVKAARPSALTVVGGHAAAVFPAPLFRPTVDVLTVADGEHVMPEVLRRLDAPVRPRQLPGAWLRFGDEPGPRSFAEPLPQERIDLDLVPLPARHHVDRFRKHYRCVHKTNLSAIETTRGCPYRCSFCSIWRHNDRSFRQRSIESVADDFEASTENVFVIDDLFWHPRQRSLELARELTRRGVKKDWMLVQARLDTAHKRPELLEAWRPLAREFDIFFGFEAPSDDQLQLLDKDSSVASTEAGVSTARHYGYGVTGNFVIDPDWTEREFEAMWALVDRLELRRCGYTVLTPLPGTPLFDQMRDRIVEDDWARYDMHHILYEPRLGRQRFFELFVESWKRNVLSAKHGKSRWLRWFKQIGPSQAWALMRVLWQTQQLLKVDSYLEESFPLQVPTGVVPESSKVASRENTLPAAAE